MLVFRAGHVGFTAMIADRSRAGEYIDGTIVATMTDVGGGNRCEVTFFLHFIGLMRVMDMIGWQSVSPLHSYTERTYHGTVDSNTPLFRY